MIIDKVDTGSSSLKGFRSSLKDVRLDRTTVNPVAVEKELEKSTEVARSLRTPLERSASSIRREPKGAAQHARVWRWKAGDRRGYVWDKLMMDREEGEGHQREVGAR